MKKTAIIHAILSAFVLLSFIPAAFAGDASSSGAVAAVSEPASAPAPDPDAREYSEKVKGKDPFEALVTPPPAVVSPGPSDGGVKPKPPEPVVEPLPIKVTFIVGSSQRKFATLCLHDKVYQMTNGDHEKSGLFSVIEVRDGEVVVFDSRVQKERTIKLVEE